MQRCGEAAEPALVHVAVSAAGQAAADHTLEKLFPVLVPAKHLHFAQQDLLTALVHVVARADFLATSQTVVVQH
jgi:hypothetical protein